MCVSVLVLHSTPASPIIPSCTYIYLHSIHTICIIFYTYIVTFPVYYVYGIWYTIVFFSLLLYIYKSPVRLGDWKKCFCWIWGLGTESSSSRDPIENRENSNIPSIINQYTSMTFKFEKLSPSHNFIQSTHEFFGW